MNLVLETIETRRSIRKYKAQDVDQNLIDQVINAGLFAASGHNRQSPIIIQVTDPQIKAEIIKLNCEIGGWKKGFDPFYGAPVILIVLAPKDISNHIYDGTLVMGNMLLAAHALNLGSCWINRAKEEFETEWGKNLLKKLGITGEYEGIGHCILGYADGEHPKTPARKEGRVFKI